MIRTDEMTSNKYPTECIRRTEQILTIGTTNPHPRRKKTNDTLVRCFYTHKFIEERSKMCACAKKTNADGDDVSDARGEAKE